MSSPNISLDPRVEMISTLAGNRKAFSEMTLMLPKKSSIEAAILPDQVREMLQKAAYDPNLSEEDLKLMDHIPYPEVATEAQQDEIDHKNYQIDIYNQAIKEASARKIPESDYMYIEDHLAPFYSARNMLSSVKGKLLQLFTKRLGDGQNKGLLGSLAGSDKE